MTRLHGWSRAWWMLCLAFLAVAPAQAAAPDPRGEHGRLEDQLVEGEIDAEDFLAWNLSSGPRVGRARGSAYVGLEAFAVEKASGASEIGALLVLELPLERFAQPRALVAPLPFEPIASSVGGSDVTGATWLAAPSDEAPSRAIVAQTGVPRAERPATTPAIAVTTEVSRSCVRAALRTMGLADDNRLDSAAARARSSAALPELRLRVVRTLGETGRISLSEDDPSRYVASGAATNVLEARLTFRLDRLLFADEEIAVERARLDRAELRSRTAAKVLQALFAWQKAYTLSQDPALSAEDHFSAVLREAESSAILDVITGGWFGAFRAALAARSP